MHQEIGRGTGSEANSAHIPDHVLTLECDHILLHGCANSCSSLSCWNDCHGSNPEEWYWESLQVSSSINFGCCVIKGQSHRTLFFIWGESPKVELEFEICFCGGRKTEKPKEKNPLSIGENKPTTTTLWHWSLQVNSNQGHVGERQQSNCYANCAFTHVFFKFT